jgi:hypothetical protein
MWTLPSAVRMVFQVVYNYLDWCLTDKDKKKFGFGAIFVEHLLCKVQCWIERYTDMPTDLLA